MAELLKLIEQLPAWLTLLVTVGGIGLTAIGVILTIRSRREKKPRWAVRSTTWVKSYASLLPKLEIRYANQPVDSLTVSQIMFWNAGSETIRSTDIPEGDPLRVIGGRGVTIYSVDVLAANNPASRFDAYLEPDILNVPLKFDYLDRGHGAIIQVVHSGKSSEDLSIAGQIIGAEVPKRRRIRFPFLLLPTPRQFDRKLKPQTRDIVNSLTVLAPIVYVILSSVGLLPSSSIGIGVAAGLVTGMFLVLFEYRGESIPLGLESFEQEIGQTSQQEAA